MIHFPDLANVFVRQVKANDEVWYIVPRGHTEGHILSRQNRQNLTGFLCHHLSLASHSGTDTSCCRYTKSHQPPAGLNLGFRLHICSGVVSCLLRPTTMGPCILDSISIRSGSFVLGLHSCRWVCPWRVHVELGSF